MEEKLKKYGFTSDREMILFDQVFRSRMFKSVSVDVYRDNPYMLYSRMRVLNVIPYLSDGRLVIKKKAKEDTTLLNIVVDRIENCMCKNYNGIGYEFVFKFGDTYCKVLVTV